MEHLLKYCIRNKSENINLDSVKISKAQIKFIDQTEKGLFSKVGEKAPLKWRSSAKNCNFKGSL